MRLLLPLTVLLSHNSFCGGGAGKLRFGGSFVAILEEQVGNVDVHGEATCALGVEFGEISLEVYAIKFLPFEVLHYGVMGGEDIS